MEENNKFGYPIIQIPDVFAETTVSLTTRLVTTHPPPLKT